MEFLLGWTWQKSTACVKYKILSKLSQTFGFCTYVQSKPLFHKNMIDIVNIYWINIYEYQYTTGIVEGWCSIRIEKVDVMEQMKYGERWQTT